MRWLFRLFFIVVLLGVAAGAFLIFLPAERIAQSAAARFSASTGRTLTISGDVNATLWPTIGVTAKSVTLANADWGAADNMLTAKQIYIGIDPTTIFSDTIAVRSIEFEGPVVDLERRSDGSNNWTLGAGESSTGPGFSLDQVKVSDGSIRYSDEGAQLIELDDTTAVLAFTYNGASLSFGAVYNQQVLAGTLSVASLPDLITARTVANADIKVGTSTLLFEGPVSLAEVSASGPLRLEITDRAAVFGLFGQVAPDLPQGFGRDRIGLIADLDYSKSRAGLANLSLNLDQNHFSGGAVVDLTGRPRFDANLSATLIDFSSLSSSGGGAAPSGWSESPFHVGALNDVDGALDIAFKQARFGVYNLGQGEMRLVLQSGEAQVDIKSIEVFDGQVSGTASANLSEALSMTGRFQASDVSTAELGAVVAGTDRLTSRMSGSIEIAGRGRSMAGLMSSLSGGGRVEFESGSLKGVDIASILRTLDPGFESVNAKTLFDGASGSFSIQSGIVENSDLVVTAPILLGTGVGEIDIGARTLDYTFLAELSGSVIGKVVELPVRLSGSWSNPIIRFDTQSLIEARFDVDLDAMSQGALDDLRERVGEELGIEIVPGQDLKEALTEGLEKRAIDAFTKGLLGEGARVSTPPVEPALPDTQVVAPALPDEPSATDVAAPEPEAPVLEAPVSSAPRTSPMPILRPAAPDAVDEPVAVEPVIEEPVPAVEPEVIEPEPEPQAEPVPEVVEPEQPVTEPETDAAEPTTPTTVDEPTVEPEPSLEPRPIEPEIAPCPDEVTGETPLPCRLSDGTLFEG